MRKLTRQDLLSLEEYAVQRPALRAQVMMHKRNRKVPVGDHITLYFEDAVTMRYQIQEMLRAERIFESEAVQEELDAYNPLIPDGTNWKCTLMIEYPNLEERRAALRRLVGLEDKVWVRVHGCDRVWAVADEDLDREAKEKTSSVHFLRFELDPRMIAAVREGANVAVGVDHDAYRFAVESLPEPVRQSLAADLG